MEDVECIQIDSRKVTLRYLEEPGQFASFHKVIVIFILDYSHIVNTITMALCCFCINVSL